MVPHEKNPPPPPRRSPAGTPIRMLRPDLENIPDFPLPAGFSIRPMRCNEAGLWTDVCRDAEPFFTIADDLFQAQFGADPLLIEQRCFLVFDEKDFAVGTVSAWRDTLPGGKEIGRIHWLAVRPAYQRRGLARAALSYALRQLARWHDRALLDTQTLRLGAIRLYLEFGFVPDLSRPDALEAWREVQNGLAKGA